MRFRPVTVLALAVGLCLSTAGCVGGSSGGVGSGGQKAVTIYTGFTADKGKRFEASLAPFEKQTGIKVTHVGIANVQSALTTRIQAGNPPDIALFPQPGLVDDLARQGKLKPLDNVLDISKLRDGMVPGLLDTTTVDNKLYGVPFDISVKSLVWYPPQPFQQAGYQIPKTFEDFTALVDKVRADGNTPLCLGVESGSGTGWAATDWLEDLVLRTGGPDVYDKWISHQIAFDSPEIKQAASLLQQLALTPGNVAGGNKAIVSTKWSDAINPMLNKPKPGCWLDKMGSFQANSLPAGTKPGTDVNVFYFPAMATGGYQGRPVEGGGDIAGLFTDNPAAKQLMQYLATADSGKPWASQGGFLSPWKTFDAANYADDLTRQESKIITDATAFRFDASDAMPAAVGTGSFFQQMTAWLNGDESLDQALQKIDASWPKQ